MAAAYSSQVTRDGILWPVGARLRVALGASGFLRQIARTCSPTTHHVPTGTSKTLATAAQILLVTDASVTAI